MKVAVNRCFGGFDLSEEAIIRLIEAGSEFITRYEDKRPENHWSELWDEYQAPEHRTEIRDGYFRDKGLGTAIYKDGWVYYHNDDRKGARTDPHLIKIIGDIGKAASGRYGDVELVEIPDGTDWEVNGYDGNERIDEVHRSW